MEYISICCQQSQDFSCGNQESKILLLGVKNGQNNFVAKIYGIYACSTMVNRTCASDYKLNIQGVELDPQIPPIDRSGK